MYGRQAQCRECHAFAHRAIKTIIGEACDATNQAKVMGYMTAGWGVGTIVGPTLGGLLARPCDVFASGLPICHDGSWFAERSGFHKGNACSGLHTDSTASS